MNIFDEEREKITECNITFCKECCDKWNFAKDQCYFKESYIYCYYDPDQKIKMMNNKRHCLKAWTEPYCAKLQR